MVWIPKYWKDRQDSHGRNQGEGLSWLSDSNFKDGKPVYDKSFGTFTYESDRKVEKDDLYDLASLTKTTATLLAVMKLYDEGKFGLTDRISQYIPALKVRTRNVSLLRSYFYISRAFLLFGLFIRRL